jgi:hypothetical protein
MLDVVGRQRPVDGTRSEPPGEGRGLRSRLTVKLLANTA